MRRELWAECGGRALRFAHRATALHPLPSTLGPLRAEVRDGH